MQKYVILAKFKAEVMLAKVQSLLVYGRLHFDILWYVEQLINVCYF